MGKQSQVPLLSILIPARNEEWLPQTVADILAHKAGDTEIIVVLDGYLPDPLLPSHEGLTIIHNPVALGQRAATNQAAKFARGEYLMKVDAHCAFDQDFDVKLLATFEPEWVMIPQMRNLHVFDWLCPVCAARLYQGAPPNACPTCGNQEQAFTRLFIWKPRDGTRNNFMRFDRDLHFQYWKEFKTRPEAQGDIADTLSLIGAAWLLRRDRYQAWGGLDEGHGSWGQMGTEIACKAWLSGGRLCVNKRTWFAHLFRTQDGFKFPYPISGADQARAVQYSQRLWRGNHWPQAVHPLAWLIEKFWPIPGWAENDLTQLHQWERLNL
jgi:hypothetical protein